MRCKERRAAAIEGNVSCGMDCMEHVSAKVASLCYVFPFATCKSLCLSLVPYHLVKVLRSIRLVAEITKREAHLHK